MLLDKAFKLPIPRGVVHTQAATGRVQPSAHPPRRLNNTTLRRPARAALQIWKFLFNRRGVFGIESDWFSVVYMVRESIEVVSQSFQARRSSELLPRPWLNNVLVTLVVANCWSTPVLQHLFHRQQHQRSGTHHHQGSERVVCLVLSATLNMAPVSLPHSSSFGPTTRRFS